MAENQTAPVDDSDMPALMDERDYTSSNLNAMIPSTRSATEQPIVVAFECRNTSKAEDLTCVICMEPRHAKTNEVVRLAKCCHCPLHLSCVYRWLAAQYDNYVPQHQWGCPHCRAPVKNLASNTDPCILCGRKETRLAYHEPVAQAVPCCSASVHQQCLYAYIQAHFTEDRFPCPGCKTFLGAQRSVSMTMESHTFHGISTQRSQEPTQRLQEPTWQPPRPPTPPYLGMRTRSRARGRGYQLHRGKEQRPVRRPYSDS